MDAKQLNPATLAFVGDAVYSLKIRDYVASLDISQKKLHSKAVEYVSANAQYNAFKVLEPVLRDVELEIFKRGRNHHTKNVPKNSDEASYHIATGLEALFGYLYLNGNFERIDYLFSLILNGDLNENI